MTAVAVAIATGANSQGHVTFHKTGISNNKNKYRRVCNLQFATCKLTDR